MHLIIIQNESKKDLNLRVLVHQNPIALKISVQKNTYSPALPLLVQIMQM